MESTTTAYAENLAPKQCVGLNVRGAEWIVRIAIGRS